ncbi:MAG: hypothetical protein LBU32_01810 [Clostridiales bacterium]|jgi:hypothetical protein|nr:hypothetical protein [Clostridiales bacterium]
MQLARQLVESLGLTLPLLPAVAFIPAFERAITEKRKIILALHEFSANGNYNLTCKSSLASSATALNSMETASFFLERRFLKGRDSRGRAPQRALQRLHALQRDRLAEEELDPAGGRSPRPIDLAALENGRGQGLPAHCSCISAESSVSAAPSMLFKVWEPGCRFKRNSDPNQKARWPATQLRERPGLDSSPWDSIWQTTAKIPTDICKSRLYKRVHWINCNFYAFYKRRKKTPYYD